MFTCGPSLLCSASESAPVPGAITWADVLGLWTFDTSTVHPIDGFIIFPSVKGYSFFYGDNGTNTGNNAGQFGSGSLKKGAGSAMEMQGGFSGLSQVTHEFRIACEVFGSGGSGANVFPIDRFSGYDREFGVQMGDGANYLTYFDSSEISPVSICSLTSVFRSVALVVDDTDLRIYVDGAQVYTKPRVASLLPATFDWNFGIGRSGYDYHYGKHYYIDELRVLNKCAYFANYTPATVAFPAPAPAPSKAIGWNSSVYSPAGISAQANSGSSDTSFGATYYAGVVGYVSGAVAWTGVWNPLGSDPSPGVSPQPGALVEIYMPDLLGGLYRTSEGCLTLTATVDGVPCSNSIALVTSASNSYTPTAWGPGGCPPAPAPTAPVSTGWSSVLVSNEGPFAHGNTSTIAYNSSDTYYAGIVGYTSGQVIWSSTWVGSAPEPVLTPSSGGRLIGIQPTIVAIAPDRTSNGVLTLTATVNGVASIDSITLTVTSGATITVGPQ